MSASLVCRRTSLLLLRTKMRVYFIFNKICAQNLCRCYDTPESVLASDLEDRLGARMS